MGFVDKDGKWISEPIYEETSAFDDDYDDLLPSKGGIGYVKLDGKTGIFDAKNVLILLMSIVCC